MRNFILFITVLFLTKSSYAQINQQLLNLKSQIKIEQKSSIDLLPNESFQKKSPGLAILYSLLLPGMGELYADNYSNGQYFTIADGIAWGFLAGFNVYGNNKQNDYKSFAQSFGKVKVENKDDTFFARVGIYSNVDEFNTEKELNREFDKTYNTSTHFWNWENELQRKEYRSLWISSENAFNNVRFAVGALILNRIVSSIFAVRAVNAYNKQESNQMSWNINFSANQNTSFASEFIINFQHSF